MFFREWERRAPGETRDVERARALAGALGVLGPSAPVLTVVGSKGKGTAATYASAFLAAAGFRVCTVTSPGLRTDRDRIRIDGRAVSSEELAILAADLDTAVRALPPPSDGYLSPSGLFLLAGVLHARRAGADALVLEAGMGGRSDEVALFPPDVAAITPVFLEHAGVLGDTEAEIAREKLGVAAPGTVVLSAPQSAPVAEVLRGRKVADNVRMLIVPGSMRVRAQAESEGLGEIFTAAGAEWRQAGCSMCLGMNPDQLAPGERCASTSNRNFEGRQGKGGRTHLVSPAVAAATAVRGTLSSPADLAPVAAH